MGGEIAVLAGQIADALAQVWPVVGGAAGVAGAKLLERIGDKAADAAGEEAVGWTRRVITRVFTRRSDGTPVDPDQPVPEDATVDAEVVETLDELTANQDSKSARRLLTRQIEDAATADPALVDVLRELASQAPAATAAIGRTGDIKQEHTSGVTIAVTGTTGDVNVDGADR